MVGLVDVESIITIIIKSIQDLLPGLIIVKLNRCSLVKIIKNMSF